MTDFPRSQKKERDWIGSKEAAAELGVTPQTLLLWHRNGTGPPFYRYGGRKRCFRRYKRFELIEFRETHRKEG